GGRLVGAERGIGVDVELDLGELDVDRQVDEDRAGTAGAHDVERLLEDVRNKRRLHDRDGPFGDGRGDLGDVDRLEILLVEAGAGRLAGDAEDRDRIGGGRVK